MPKSKVARNTTGNEEGGQGRPRPLPFRAQLAQIICATIPLMALIGYFLYEAFDRQHHPCEADDQYNNGGDDQPDQTECYDELLRLVDMTAICLIVCLLWTILAVYLNFYVPRRHELLKRYMDEGSAVLGDVFYEKTSSCGGCRKKHHGHLTYRHPNFKVFPVYVRKTIEVAKHYSRKKTPIVVLPDKPYSGIPRSEVETDYAAAIKTRKRRLTIAAFCWTWVAFSGLAPIYLIIVLNGLYDTGDGKFTMISWIMYAAFIALILPLVSILVNNFTWNRYLFQTTMLGRIAEEGEQRNGSGNGWFDGDTGGKIYIPPRQYSADENDETTMNAQA